MDPRDLDVAVEFCRLVGTGSLFEYLGIAPELDPTLASERLRERRRYLQSMQSNTKFRQESLFLIKNFGSLEAVIGQPALHLADAQRRAAREKLPMLEMAIDSVLSDGVLTASEEDFVRRAALDIGIPPDMYESILRERAAERGIALPTRTAVAPPPFTRGGKTLRSVAPQPVPRPQGPTWWEPAFTRALVAALPAGPCTVADLASGPGWSAWALLPERADLRWVGVDDDAERQEHTRRTLGSSPLGGRVALVAGRPDATTLPDGTIDAVLSVMALQQPRAGSVLAEAARIVRPGGRVVAVEPDGLGHRFWFDGALPEVDEAFRALRQAGAERGFDPAIGPRLSAMLADVGLRTEQAQVVLLQAAQIEPVTRLVARLRTLARSLAAGAGLPETDPRIEAVDDRLDALLARRGEDLLGLGAHALPVFVIAGGRP